MDGVFNTRFFECFFCSRFMQGSGHQGDPPPLVVPLFMIEQKPFPPGGAEWNPVKTAGPPRAPAAGNPASCAA